jgi:hypothetical protein
MKILDLEKYLRESALEKLDSKICFFWDLYFKKSFFSVIFSEMILNILNEHKILDLTPILFYFEKKTILRLEKVFSLIFITQKDKIHITKD